MEAGKDTHKGSTWTERYLCRNGSHFNTQFDADMEKDQEPDYLSDHWKKIVLVMMSGAGQHQGLGVNPRPPLLF
jgi:hypothetical protein